MTNSPKKPYSDLSWKHLALAAIFIWGICMMALLFLIPRIEHGSEFTGQLGDSFGIINSLLSALALAGIYLTYQSQKEQLAHVKNDSEQRTTEDRFFRMLEAHQSLVNSLAHIQLEVEYTGKIALLREYERLVAFNFLSMDGAAFMGMPETTVNQISIINVIDAFQNNFGTGEWKGKSEDFKRIVIPFALSEQHTQKVNPSYNSQKEAFLKFHSDAKSRIGHYFTSTLSIISFINQCQSAEDKAYYFSLIKAQLSPQEQALLFYYNRFKATPDEKTVLENSDLFQDVSSSDLIHPSHTNLPPPPQAGEGTFEVAP